MRHPNDFASDTPMEVLVPGTRSWCSIGPYPVEETSPRCFPFLANVEEISPEASQYWPLERHKSWSWYWKLEYQVLAMYAPVAPVSRLVL